MQYNHLEPFRCAFCEWKLMFGSAQLFQLVDLNLQRKFNQEDFLQLWEEWDNKNWWAKVEHHSLWEKAKNNKGIKFLWNIREYWRNKLLGVRAYVVWLLSWIEDIQIDNVWSHHQFWRFLKKYKSRLNFEKIGIN